MPKKFRGENSKAAEARARKAAILHDQQSRKQQQEEDEYWRDDDKHVLKKQQRKEDKEKKRIEQLERKRELQQLQEEEMNSMKSNKPSGSIKVTRAQIEQTATQERIQQEAAARQDSVHDEVPLEENVNRLVPTEGEARSVEEALKVLSVKPPEVDMHPEKRMKAAYLKYEEERLPELKRENPNLRLSQLKQMLRKDWMKSPENPLNQM